MTDAIFCMYAAVAESTVFADAGRQELESLCVSQSELVTWCPRCNVSSNRFH